MAKNQVRKYVITDSEMPDKSYVEHRLVPTRSAAKVKAIINNAHLSNLPLHRDGDDPAVEHADGTKEWYKHGVRHRIGGPAIENVDGTFEFWLSGKQCSLDVYLDMMPDELHVAVKLKYKE